MEEAPHVENEEQELDVFDRARLQFSDGPRLKLRISRYEDGKTAYLKQVDYDPEAIDEDWIRKKWGPGSYQLRFLDTENPQHGWSKVIDIASDTPIQSQQQAPSSGLTESFIVSMLQRQNEIMLSALVGKGGGSAPALGGSNEAMVELIRGMSSQNTELLRAAMNKPDTSSTMLSVFEKGLQLAADAKMDSEGGWMAQFGRIARELAPMLSEVARARAERPIVYTPPAPAPVRSIPATTTTPAKTNGTPAPAPAPNAPPSPSSPGFVRTDGGSPGETPTPPSSPSSSPSPSDDTMDLTRGMGDAVEHALRQFAPEILREAESGTDAREVADGVLQSIPPMFYPELEKLTPEKVIGIEPRLSQHRKFVTDLLDGFKDDGEGDGGSDATG